MPTTPVSHISILNKPGIKIFYVFIKLVYCVSTLSCFMSSKLICLFITSLNDTLFVTGSYDSTPEYTGMSRHNILPGAPPLYTQSDFARFPPKSYHHKPPVNSSAVVHGNY